MSDLSDPTALPDEVRRRLDTLINGAIPYTLSHNWREDIGALLDERNALATELDGLRAQIELIREQVERPFTESLDIGKQIGSILAQSPRGTVARIQTETLEAFADKLGKTAFARDEVVGLLCDEADALREGAGQ